MTNTITISETCQECGGYGVVVDDDVRCIEADCNEVNCTTCNGSGTAPIIYTPEGWLAAGYELHDDLAVWVLTNRWVLSTFGTAKKASMINSNIVIIATPAITKEVLESLK